MTKDPAGTQPAASTESAPAGSRWRQAGKLLLGRDTTAPGTGTEAAVPGIGGSPQIRLVLLSFLMLFVELALIRWLGANIVYLSYYSNFVLLGSFLGIGLGFLRARSRVNLFRWTPVALALLIMFVLVFPVQISHTSGTSLIFFGALKTTGLPTWLTLPIIFLSVAAVMAMIGEGVARTFIQFKPLDAYRLDIAGSIAGTVAFSALSFVNAEPIIWGAVVVVVLLALFGKRIGVLQVAALLGLTGMLAAESMIANQLWSPYYRITVAPTTAKGTIPIMVNGIPHQAIIAAAKRPAIYYLPYREAQHNPLNNVLDHRRGHRERRRGRAAEGARHVDAVEIDPLIYQLGHQANSDHPYQQPAGDRARRRRTGLPADTKKQYNLILFALPDSLTAVAGQSTLRLESYLLTLAVGAGGRGRIWRRAARSRCTTTTGRSWLTGTRHTIWMWPTGTRRAPGRAAARRHARLSVLTVRGNPAAVHCVPTCGTARTGRPPATDDHPFPYLAGQHDPGASTCGCWR